MESIGRLAPPLSHVLMNSLAVLNFGILTGTTFKAELIILHQVTVMTTYFPSHFGGSVKPQLLSDPHFYETTGMSLKNGPKVRTGDQVYIMIRYFYIL